MSAVLKHEISSYFSGVSGYVFGVFLLLFAGIYTMVINLKASLASFEYVLSNMSFIFLIIVPILTMRVIAEERRQKTDQLLYSLPLSMTEVVLGKYLALLVVFLIPTLIISVYPLILSRFGDVYLPGAYGSIVGFFFLGAALTSIGMFVSSLTESQPVAAGLCFTVMLVNYFISSLTSYLSSTAFASMLCLMVLIFLLAMLILKMTGSGGLAGGIAVLLVLTVMAIYIFKDTYLTNLIPDIVEKLSLFERFYTFTNGVFDLTAIVYFITVIGVFLFLTVQSMEKRRWSK